MTNGEAVQAIREVLRLIHVERTVPVALEQRATDALRLLEGITVSEPERLLMRLRESAKDVLYELDELRPQVESVPATEALDADVMRRCVSATRELRHLDKQIAPCSQGETRESVPFREFRYELRMRSAWLEANALPSLRELEPLPVQ